MKQMFRGSLLIALMAATLVSACASFEGLQPKSQPVDAASLAVKDSLSVMPGTSDSWPTSSWWKVYGDPQLDTLIGEALAGNPTLAAARARIEQADALAAAADAGRQPQLGGSASIDRQRFTEDGIFPPPIAGAIYTTSQLALNFSHEFDFWGRQRATLDAALSRARAAAIEGEAARLTLATAAARSYIELDHQYALLDVAEASLKQRERIHDLAESRFSAGLESKVELHQSSSQVFAARTDLAVARERIALIKNELAALTGQGPDRGLAIARPKLEPGPDGQLPARLPAELLGRRPDIVAQRLRVEAAGGDIAAARAHFYPNVNLSALLGLQSINLDHLLEGGNRMVDVNAALTLPIFDGGRLRANLAARDADYDLAVAQYNSTLVEALRDVADQVNSWHAIDLQSAEQRQAQAEAEEAYRLALLRYQGDLSNYLSVLSVESQVLAQQRLGADLRARRLAVSISLARALGGGFQIAPLSNSNHPKL